jgi:biotin carboxyl carrier protein
MEGQIEEVPLATSMNKMEIIVDGIHYTVEIEDATRSPAMVKVNDRIYTVEWKTAAEKGNAPLPAVKAQPAAVAEALPPPRPGIKPPTPATEASVPPAQVIKAPMPGNIVDIQVKAGSRVKIRDPLCYLEAMKMKNVIRSPRDGVIASVEVKDGQTVAYDDVLFIYLNEKQEVGL